MQRLGKRCPIYASRRLTTNSFEIGIFHRHCIQMSAFCVLIFRPQRSVVSYWLSQLCRYKANVRNNAHLFFLVIFLHERNTSYDDHCTGIELDDVTTGARQCEYICSDDML
jgi:hypothetical protein